jgi:putative endonuclease
MASCYILHSSSLDKFYIGATRHKTHIRTLKHNSAFYGPSFTSKVNDWKVLLEIPCSSFEQALKIEKHIKKMNLA